MKFLIITNHSYMLWQFRRELIAALQERGEVVLSMPFVGHERDFMAMGCRCIDTPFERRSINPVTDGKLLLTYHRMLREEKPDLVITYSIKPNIYVGFLCGQMHIPYCVNVQGLGTAFQKELIATLVTQMYRVALKRAKAVFFENEGNAREFVERGILPADKPTVLHGAGINMASYAQQPYPELGAKLDQYFLALAGEPVAVQNEECDFLIETCQDSLVRQYTALKIYDHYLKSKIMGDDAVAVHVAREWFLSGKVKMKSEEDAFHAQLFVQFNENSLIGSQAPVLTLFAPDSTRQYVPQKGGYSVLYFYDAGCATCKRETPKLLGLTESGKYPITVYAIYVGASKEEWESWRMGKDAFVHLWDPEVSSNWQLLYGVLQTPKMYLVGPEGTILGRGLDASALDILLNRELSREEYIYGEEGEMERLRQLFGTYGDTLKVKDVMDVADYMAARTFGEGDVNAYKQTIGDLLYYLFSQRTEVYRDASIPFIQKYIEQPEIWNTEADKAQVSSLGELMLSLSRRTPVGSAVPDLTVPGTLRRKPGLFCKGTKTKDFRLRKLRGKPSYLVFYTQSCQVCQELLSAVDSLVEKDRKVRVLLIDMEALFRENPAKAEELLDTFDLSVLPFVLQMDRKGIVEHRYVQLLK